MEGDLRGTQGKLCFAYLALHHDRAVPRAELEHAIWPERAPSSPSAALSTLLSRLRRALGDGVIQGRAELQLALPEGSSLDVEDAREAIASGNRSRVSAAAKTLSQELLAGFEAPWVDQARRELEELRVGALELQAELAIEAGEPTEAERAARELIRVLPYRESGHRQLMAALERQGNLAEALRAYEELRVMLRDELGTAPSREIAAAHSALLGGEADEPGAAAPAEDEPEQLPQQLRAALETGAPFVGRTSEVEELDRLFQGRGARSARIALVHGDPGIGKTRLCAQFGAIRSAEGTRVLYGRCEEAVLSQYQPFVEALGAWAVTAPEGELRNATDGLGEAASLVPQLRRRLPDLPETSAGGDRLLLFDDLAEMLARATRFRPLLLVLDDLHWADEATLLLLKRLVRSPQPIDCLIVGTYRITEFESPLTDALADLARDGEMAEVALMGLDAEQIAELVASGVGSESLGDGVIGEIAHRSEGNPFFASELARQLSTNGEGDGSAELTSGASALIARRLRGFGPDELDLLSLAAVMGRDFTFELLQTASGEDPVALAAVLERAATARAAREVPGTVGRYSFDHALIQDFLYQRVHGQRRAQLHLQVAEALDEIATSNPEPYIEQFAHHFANAAPAGATERAIEWSTIAGWHAQTTHAHERAAGHYRRAHELIGPDGPPGHRADLLILAGESLVRAGKIEAGRRALLEAAELARSISDGERLAAAALSYGDSGGSWSMELGRSDPLLVSLLEEALSRLNGDHAGTRALLSGRLAIELFWSDSAERADQLGDDAVELARRTSDPDQAYRALLGRAIAIWRPREIDQRQALTKEALELSLGSSDRSAHANAAMWHALALAEDAEVSGGWELFERFGGEAVAEARNAMLRWIYQQVMVNRAIAEGRLGEATEKITRVIALAPDLASDDPAKATSYSAFMVIRERGQMEGLEDTVNELLAEAEGVPGLAGTRMIAATGLIELGRADEAREQVASLGSDFSGLLLDNLWTLGVSHAAEVIAATSDEGPARALYEVAVAQGAARLCVTAGGAGLLGSMERYLGLLAETMGDPAVARGHFERAIEVNERKGGLLEAAHSRVDLAGVTDDEQRRGELLKEALALTEERGDLVRLRDRAGTQLQL